MIRDCNNKIIIKMKYISTERDIADIMAKALDKVKHRYFTGQLLQLQETNNEEQ